MTQHSRPISWSCNIECQNGALWHRVRKPCAARDWISMDQSWYQFQFSNSTIRAAFKCIWVLPHDELQYLPTEWKCKFGQGKRVIILQPGVRQLSANPSSWLMPSLFIVPSQRISINQAWSGSKWIYTNNQACTDIQSQLLWSYH